MSELVKAARDGDLDEMQRLIGDGASVHEEDQITGWTSPMCAAYSGNASVLLWLLKETEARISDVNAVGWTVLSIAASQGHYYLLEWMLTEGGALITDVMVQDGGDSNTMWDSMLLFPGLASNVSAKLSSLLKVMVLLDDAPAKFIYIATLSPQNTEIVT
jgi:hypothetical protein